MDARHKGFTPAFDGPWPGMTKVGLMRVAGYIGVTGSGRDQQ
jgi:hypothetical protein